MRTGTAGFSTGLDRRSWRASGRGGRPASVALPDAVMTTDRKKRACSGSADAMEPRRSGTPRSSAVLVLGYHDHTGLLSDAFG